LVEICGSALVEICGSAFFGFLEIAGIPSKLRV